MKKSQLKAIIMECLEELEIDERTIGDPNSLEAHGQKIQNIKPKKQKQPNIAKPKYFKNGIERKIRTQ